MLRRSNRLLILEIALPLLLLGALELGMRWYANRGPQPLLPRFFPFPITTAKYLAYQAAADRSLPIDVLLMGMSPMLRVNAGDLEATLAGRVGSPVHVFNFAAPLQTAGFNLRLLRDVLVRLGQPHLVVYGVMPINLLHDESSIRTEINVRLSPVFAAHDGTVSAALRAALMDHVALVRYRDLLRDRLRASFDADDLLQQMAETTDERGDIPYSAPDAPVTTLTPWENDYVREFRAFDHLLQSSRFFAHLAAVARFCKSRGIGFVLLNNAVHPKFLEMLPNGRADYDRFVAHVRSVAVQEKVPFFDPAAGGIGSPEHFQDTHHHNERGARWLTEQLAGFLVGSRLLEPPAPSG